MGSFWVCGWSTNGLIGTHFVPAAHDHGMPPTTSASLLALIGLFDIVGTVASGWLTDRYGVSWQIVPQALLDMLSKKDSAAAQRAMAAMLGMKKLDIAALQRAYRNEEGESP